MRIVALETGHLQLIVGKNNMNNGNVVFVFFGVMFALLIGLSIFGGIQEEKAGSRKLDDCIKLVNEIYPDPNDTEHRSAYLQECVDGK